ncbi:cupin domain-containing protein [Rhodophyticola sp. CCM32]|uniref:cupin domain-containing protein n=1 Tax=Rhodophyticola sp. CCM32 TaxID=2916397 RepID=UPI001AEFF01C|nr:cupin domain-containing protein [Rhodophyticola sp. CCM32]
MPKIDAPRIEEGGDETGRFRAELLSDTGGLTQFGAFIETLWPEAASSKSHWHRSEDEMVYVLDGVITLIEGGVVTELHTGDTACFKAGLAVGHHLETVRIYRRGIW